ncbi:hypothetical protein [Solibacillus sp. FSL H8-0538]|uniref:hypothetical protein n=1 Tax=Solibacillus sp. FSL H8-0538 TaxID=2921400 RepID=UPI0030FC7C35
MKSKSLKIATLAHAVYKKCECCNRVKDIYFKMSVLDAAKANYLVGDFDLCKSCGQNFGDILNIKVSTENVLNDFNFSKT